jgi:hypothetical protein
MKVILQARVEKLQSTKVIINYYQGRLAAIEGKTDQAIRELLDAYRGITWTVCRGDPKALANKKRAFERLVPLAIISGRLPKKSSIEKFNLGRRYDNLITATRAGDLRRLKAALDENEAYFTKLGCANLLRAKMQAVTNQHLLKSIHKQLQEIVASNSMDLKSVSRLSCWNETFSGSDEDRLCYLLCVVSDLVSRDLLRGTVDANFVLTFDAKTPFPTLSKAQPKSYKVSKW